MPHKHGFFILKKAQKMSTKFKDCGFRGNL